VSQASESHAALRRFPTTDWSLVVAAGSPGASDARESLAALCGAYWYPIYAYIRRQGHSPDAAQDLTQDFFARILEKGLFAEADPGRGRFRSFPRTVCIHYLANRREWRQAQKRGGGRAPLSIDRSDAETRYAIEPSHDLTPEMLIPWGFKHSSFADL
jgi:DNA-directed RNA polymerase specialized sigma24 family protein